MIEIDRYDPREDKEALKEIFEDFIRNMSYFPGDWQSFEKELNKRALDLKSRNAMVVAREDGKLVGWGTYSLFKHHLGGESVLIHQVLRKKEDSHKKGIEEMIINEIQTYVKKVENIHTIYSICPDNDSTMRSIFMKLGLKKSKLIYYDKTI